MTTERRADLQTFDLPDTIRGSTTDDELGQAMIRAWRRDGAFQIATTPGKDDTTAAALAASRRFFGRPLSFKAACVSDLSYSGYVASGDEINAGEADAAEIFTVCKDLPRTDPRVRAGWPGHGPVPWPDAGYERDMKAFMQDLGDVGDRVLQLAAMGLELTDLHAFTRLTDDGWHHLRALRSPATSGPNTRGMGARTHCGLLALVAQDDLGGFYVRPPVEGEPRRRNWLPGESTAGMYEDQEPWTYVPPTPRVLTAFPGDIMQFMTNGYLLSTPHKLRRTIVDRHAMTYLHEPNFYATVRPFIDIYNEDDIHYGSHFTHLYLRAHPDRLTTRRILDEDRLAVLRALRGDRRTA